MKKKLLKILIRTFLQPAFSPRVSVKLRRRWLNLASICMARAPKASNKIKCKWQPLGTIHTFVAYPDDEKPTEHHILYLHGGGYVSGGVGTHGHFVKHLAAYTKITVWMPDYRLAPEHPYPAALDDAIVAYKELFTYLTETTLGNSSPSINIIGDSAGGGLALACAQALRDLGYFPKAVVLLSPWVDLTCSNNSYTSRATSDPMLNPDGIRACAAYYCGDVPLNQPGCSPIFADLSNLPPLLIQVGSEEILYDDATLLNKKLKPTNTPTTLQVYEGMWHVFQFHAEQLQESRDALSHIAAFIHKANQC